LFFLARAKCSQPGRTPPRNYTLEYVEVIQRHHKRTPYASNTFPKEDIPWTCTKAGPVYYAKGFAKSFILVPLFLSSFRRPAGVASDVVPIQWQAYANLQNPWTNSVNPGFVGSTYVPMYHTHLFAIHSPLAANFRRLRPRDLKTLILMERSVSLMFSGLFFADLDIGPSLCLRFAPWTHQRP
jgi:hypothetical protein